MTSTPLDRWTGLRERKLARDEARQQYERTRSSVIAMRQLLQTVDTERERAGLTRSELARRIGTTPAAIRRLFTSPTANPTLRTALALFDVLDL